MGFKDYAKKLASDVPKRPETEEEKKKREEENKQKEEEDDPNEFELAQPSADITGVN